MSERPIVPAEAVPEQSRLPGHPLRSAWVWTGLILALAGRMLASGRPDRTPDLWILAIFALPCAILAYWAYTQDAGRRSLLRALRAALFAFLAVEAFYWGISIGGLAAAAGAFMIFTRFIRPRKPNPAE